jgi:NAD(P)-dependent dehydrogenase (short-subunit alcohol dehydrogenase family)
MLSGVAIVTGGTGALGQAVTLRLLGEGATVWVPYVVPAERDTLLARVGAPPDRRRLRLDEVDVANAVAMDRFVDRIAGEHSGVDVLVTAVGGFAGGSLVETDLATWQQQLALNLTSAFAAARAVVPGMIGRRYGRIVMVASRAVLPPRGGFIAYTVSKAAVVTLVQALAEETREHGVTVNAVAPSTMDTPGNRRAMPDADPKGWVPVESVADAIAFLARQEAGHITGTVLAI